VQRRVSHRNCMAYGSAAPPNIGVRKAVQRRGRKYSVVQHSSQQRRCTAWGPYSTAQQQRALSHSVPCCCPSCALSWKATVSNAPNAVNRRGDHAELTQQSFLVAEWTNGLSVPLNVVHLFETHPKGASQPDLRFWSNLFNLTPSCLRIITGTGKGTEIP